MGRRNIPEQVKRRIIELRESNRDMAWFEISHMVSADDPLITAHACCQIYRREMILRNSPPQPQPKPKPKKPKADHKRRIPEQDKELILRLYEEGLGWKEIADRIDDPLTDAACCRGVALKRAANRTKPKPKPKRRPKPSTNKKRKRSTVSGGCKVCNGMVSFVIKGKSMYQIEQMHGVCDTCNTLFQIKEVLDVDSIHPVQQITDDYDSYVGMRLGKMCKQVP